MKDVDARFKSIHRTILVLLAISLFLPAAVNVQYGFYAAAFGTIKFYEQPSLGAFVAGFSNFLILSIVFFPNWITKVNKWIVLLAFLLAYAGVLSWLAYPNDFSLVNGLKQLSHGVNNLSSGYWLWNISTLGFLILHFSRVAKN